MKGEIPMERSQPKRREPIVYPRIPFHIYFTSFVPGTIALANLFVLLMFVPYLAYSFGEWLFFIPMLIPVALGGGASWCILRGHRLTLRMSVIFTVYLAVATIPPILMEFFSCYNSILFIFCPYFWPLYVLGIPLQIASIIIILRKKIGHTPAGDVPAPNPIARKDHSYPHVAGETLCNRYRVIEGIGQGASGSAYLVRDLQYPESEVCWVLKEVDMQALSSEEQQEAMELFQRECQLLRGLNHPAIPKLIDCFHNNGSAYMVMEHVAGRSLEEVTKSSRKPVDTEKILEISMELSEILSYLHSQAPHPLIFRDLKPSNIIITEKGRLRLIDFGISRFFNPGKLKDTFIYGTPGFSPPEQYGTGQTDERSDIYAYGATLYYLLTLQDLQSFYFKFPPVRRFNRNASREFDRIISKCLRKNPGERYENVTMVQHELKKVEMSNRYDSQNSLPELWPGLYFLLALLVAYVTANIIDKTTPSSYVTLLIVTLAIPAAILIAGRLGLNSICFSNIASRAGLYLQSLTRFTRPAASNLYLQRRIK